MFPRGEDLYQNSLESVGEVGFSAIVQTVVEVAGFGGYQKHNKFDYQRCNQSVFAIQNWKDYNAGTHHRVRL